MISGQSRAAARMARYMEDTGCRIEVSRKIGAAWEVVATDVPAIIESSRTLQPVDPTIATKDDSVTRKITVMPAAGILPADRILVTAPRGTGVIPGQVLTIASVDLNSMAPCTTGSAVVEQVAVESYPVTIERWSDAASAYIEVLTANAAVVSDRESLRGDQRGTVGRRITGTLILDVPEKSIIPGDEVHGIPWAMGAVVSRVYPQVGSRLEVAFTYTTGEST